MRKLTTALVAVGAVGALMLTGCSSSERNTTPSDSASGSSSAAAGFDAGATIGVALPQKTSENWVLAEGLFNKDLTAAGFKPLVQFANGGVTEQQNQIQAMVEQGAKVIVVGAIDGSQLGSQLEAAAAAGIKVIAYDRLMKNTAPSTTWRSTTSRSACCRARPCCRASRSPQGRRPVQHRAVRRFARRRQRPPFFKGAMDILQPKIDDGTLGRDLGSDHLRGGRHPGLEGRERPGAHGQPDHQLLRDAPTRRRPVPERHAGPRGPDRRHQAAKLTPVVTGQDSEVESVKSIMAGEQYSTIYKDTRKLVAETLTMIEQICTGEVFPTDAVFTTDSGVEIPSNYLEPIIVTSENGTEVYADNEELLAAFQAGQ